MEIIPAIDLMDGKCVRLTQGDFAQKKEYNSNPLEVAKSFEQAGIRRLHLVDLDGARQKKIVNHKVLEAIAAHTSLHIDFGGGIQSEQDIELAFACGAAQITAGSIAIRHPEMVAQWLEKYGSEKIILGADARDERIAVSGWQEITDTSVFDFAGGFLQKGARYVICTDVSKDGLLQGPSLDLYGRLLGQFPDMKLIASGGVSGIEDLHDLERIGAYGAIVGKAFYEGRISLEQLSGFVNS